MCLVCLMGNIAVKQFIVPCGGPWHDPAVSSKSGEIVVARPDSPELGRYAAAALVFGASASVLVVEVVALRLLAPYLGLTLETSTLVIGVALAAIALGSWAGGPGRRPDAAAPGAGSAAGSVRGGSGGNSVRRTGGWRVRSWGAVLMLVSTFAIIVPGTFLAAVTPMVTKLRLTSLNETGTVVGRLSAIGTAGAIVGTVVTGFVLISRLPVSVIMVGSRSGAGPRRGGGRVPGTRLAVGGRSGGARAPRRRCRRDRTWWLRRGDDLPLCCGRA